MGKSTAARILAGREIPVVDTDDLARQVVQPGQPALDEICAAFGGELIDATGQLRREQLAQIVFADPAARAKLEAITHPRITDRCRQQLQSWRNEGRRSAVVVIPLLFETRAESNFDTVICVACSEGTQRRRLGERGWSGAQIQQRLSAQLPIAEKMGRANFVVWTEGGVDSTAQQLAKIIPG
jgi:dephospho-CoA kinase